MKRHIASTEIRPRHVQCQLDIGDGGSLRHSGVGQVKRDQSAAERVGRAICCSDE